MRGFCACERERLYRVQHVRRPCHDVKSGPRESAISGVDLDNYVMVQNLAEMSITILAGEFSCSYRKDQLPRDFNVLVI